MRRFIFGITIIFITISSCKPLRKIGKEEIADLNSMLKHKIENNLNKDFSMERARIEIETDKKFSFSGKIYFVQNQAIYATFQLLGFEVACILITEDSIKYVNRIDRKYAFISMERVRKQYFSDASLRLIQNLVINGIIIPDNLSPARWLYFVKNYENGYVFEPSLAVGQNLKMYYSEELKLNRLNFADFKKSLFVDAEISYNNYKDPEKLVTEVISQSEKYRVNINVGRIENKRISIPVIQINNRYSEIVL